MGIGGGGQGPNFKILAELGVDPRSIPALDKEIQRVGAQSGKKFQESLRRGMQGGLGGAGTDARLLSGLRSGFKDVTTEIDLTGQSLDNVSRNPLKRFTGALETAEGSLSKYGITSRDVAIIAGAGLAGGIAFALRSIVQFTQASIQAASALREQKTASEELFGAQAELVQGFAAGAEDIGFSETAALEASNSFANLFVNLGITEEQVGTFSTELVKLAGDLASFRDLEPEDVITRLNAGLVGELETLRRLGPQLNANIIQREAEVRGITEEGVALTEAQKVLVRYLLILENTQVAQGDFERTAGSLANRQRQLNAQWENAKASLGEGLQEPAILVTTVLSELTEEVNNAFAALTGLLTLDFSKIGEGIGGLLGLSLEDGFSIGDIPGIIERRLLGPVGSAIVDAARDTFVGVEDAAAEFGGAFDFDPALSGIQGVVSETDELNNALAETGQEFTGVGSIASSIDLTSSLEEAARSARDVTAALKELEEAMPDLESGLERISERSASAGDRIADANRALARTIRDTGERVAEARERIIEVEEQAARSIEDAQKRISDAHEAAAKAIESAQDRVADAVKRVQEAEESLAETREDAAKRILEAEQRLEDLRTRGLRESQRQRRLREIAEAEQAVVEAREDAAERIEDAEKRVQDAREALTDAEEELADVRIEQDERIAEAMEARRDAEVQAARNIGDAKKQLARTERDAAESIADAQRRVADAHQSSGKAARDNARDLDKLIDTMLKTRDALTPLGRSLIDRANETDNFNEKLRLMNEFLDRATNQPHTVILDTAQAIVNIDELTGKVRELAEIMFNPRPVGGTGSGSLADIIFPDGFREHGGPVRAGGAYLVGEGGGRPELFIPNQSGQVISNDVLERLLAALSGLGRGGNNYNINLPSADPDMLVRALSSRLGRRTRR